MTCLNYQTFDNGQQFNRALFQTNGGCGYVLQRSILAPADALPSSEGKQFTVTVVCAQFLPKLADDDRVVAELWDRFDPQRLLPTHAKPPSTGSSNNVYCVVEVWQSAGPNEEPVKFSTRKSDQNGLNPQVRRGAPLRTSACASATPSLRAGLAVRRAYRAVLTPGSALPGRTRRPFVRRVCLGP